MLTSSRDSLEFVNQFVSLSKKYKQPYQEVWREVIQNFTLDSNYGSGNMVHAPYGKSRRNNSWGEDRRHIVLKDGETHKAIMTYASRLVTTVIGDARGEYVLAEPVGYEDAQGKGRTVTSLMRYFYGMPGVFRTMVEAVVDMLLMGTAIIYIPWRYEEVQMPVRSVGIDPFTGEDIDDFSLDTVVSYNDPDLVCVGNQDFYPDPTESRLSRMVGVARGFRMNGSKATEMAESGLFDAEAVRKAIGSLTPVSRDEADQEEDFRDEQPEPGTQSIPAEFRRMRGYEYCGEVPWKPADRVRRRIITTLNNVVVRDRPWPYADAELPYRELVINPINGRFYGLSPGEVIRHDQDLADVVKSLLAMAIIRQVEPPIIYDTNAGIDQAKLRAWRPNTPIGVDGNPNNVIGTVQYGANVFNGFQLAAAEKQAMQETSGASRIVQGLTDNTRRSATEAQITSENAMSRPELGAMLLERETMPAISRSVLRRYQQFISTQQLAERVGEQPQPVWVGEIMGDYDIRFMGSRRALTRQQKLQGYDRLAAITAAIPEARIMIPWQQMLQELVGDVLELPEVASLMTDPAVMQQNILMQQLLGSQETGNGNGATTAPEPAGLIPAQAAGGVG